MQVGANPYQNNRFNASSLNTFNHGHHHKHTQRASEIDLSVAKRSIELTESNAGSSNQITASQRSLSIEQSGFDSRRDLVQSAKTIMRKAIGSLARDFGQAFESMGLGNGGDIKDMLKAFMKPMMQALRSGADFSGQLSMAAIQKTSLTSASGTSESFSLVAKSINIEINQDTGELKLDVEQVQIEQDRKVSFLAPPPVTPVIDAEAATPPPTTLGDVIEAAAEPEAASTETPDAPEIAQVALPLEIALPDSSEESDEGLLQTSNSRLTINSMQAFRNQDGERIVQLFADARISLSRTMASEPEAVSILSSARIETGMRLDLRA